MRQHPKGESTARRSSYQRWRLGRSTDVGGTLLAIGFGLASLAELVTEAPLPSGPNIVVSAEQCVHRGIRVHRGA